MGLTLTSIHLKMMHEHALETYPNECVGFFFGEQVGADRIVQRVLPLENAYEGSQHNRFAIDPHDQLKAIKYAEQEQMELLGLYHSHPNHPAVPSKLDQELASYSYSYVILSLGEGKMDATRCWQLDDNRIFREETLLVTSSE